MPSADYAFLSANLIALKKFSIRVQATLSVFPALNLHTRRH